MRRAPHPSTNGILFLLGKRPPAHPDAGCEKIITIMFDRSAFQEAEAEDWWRHNRSWATSLNPLSVI